MSAISEHASPEASPEASTGASPGDLILRRPPKATPVYISSRMEKDNILHIFKNVLDSTDNFC